MTPLAATVSLARVADELGYRRYWLAEHHNMPAVAATSPPVLIAMVAAATERIRVGSGGVMLPEPCAAGRRRAVRAARGRPPGADRPRHRPGAGHRPGDQLRPAARRGRGERRGGHPLPRVRRQCAGDDGRRRGRAERRRAGCTSSGPRRARPACRRSGCSGPPTTARGSRRRRGCPTSSRTTSPAPGTAEALELYRSEFRPSPELAEPRTFLTVNAVGGRRPRRRPTGWRCRSCWRWWRCGPALR